MRAFCLGLFVLIVAGVTASSNAQTSPLQAGQWEIRATTKMTGVPRGNRYNKSRTERRCLSKQASEQGVRNILIANGCTIKHFTMANGKIDAESSCVPAGRAMISNTTGTYTTTTVHGISHSTMSGPMPMALDAEYNARRVGICPTRH